MYTIQFILTGNCSVSRSPSGGLFGASPRSTMPQSASQRSFQEENKPQRRGLSSRGK